MARLFTPARLLVAGLLLLSIAAILYLAPSNEYIFLPDRAQPVGPFVTFPGEKDDDDGGGIYYVAVDVRKASILEKLIPGLKHGSTLVPAEQLRPAGESEQARRRGELRQMARSQEVAAAVALQALGRPVTVRSQGTPIAAVAPDGPSAGKLEPSDVIVKVDGREAAFPADLRRLIRKHQPGDVVKLTVRRDRRLAPVDVKTIADPSNPKRPLIGVITDCSLDTAAQIKLPVPVKIDIGQVGGPSAGLAFALDIAEALGHDVDHGYKVVATGEICLDGTVGPVGALKQKTIGARRAGADVFLVPAGENAEEAKRYAGDLRVIPVKSFRQALRALATLPPKSSKS